MKHEMKNGIVRRGKSSWRIKYEIGRDPTTNKRQTGYKTVRGTKEDAKRELTKVLHEINQGAYIAAAKDTIDEYLDRWLCDYAKNNVSPKTYERYAEIVTNHLIPALGAVKLKDLKPLQIQAYYSDAIKTYDRNERRYRRR